MEHSTGALKISICWVGEVIYGSTDNLYTYHEDLQAARHVNHRHTIARHQMYVLHEWLRRDARWDIVSLGFSGDDKSGTRGILRYGLSDSCSLASCLVAVMDNIPLIIVRRGYESIWIWTVGWVDHHSDCDRNPVTVLESFLYSPTAERLWFLFGDHWRVSAVALVDQNSPDTVALRRMSTAQFQLYFLAWQRAASVRNRNCDGRNSTPKIRCDSQSGQRAALTCFATRCWRWSSRWLRYRFLASAGSAG